MAAATRRKSATKTWTFKGLRLIAVFGLLCTVGCGLLGDDVDEQNKDIYVDIPDPAFLKACLAACDLNGDGRVSRYEAQGLFSLSCPDAGIQTVTGIQEFIYLRTFDCSGNQIGAMDLRQNTRLEQVVCSDNKLTYLDVRGLYALTELLCNNNMLASLDVGQNQALSILDVSNNRLTVLDVSQCAQNMQRLSARGNPQLVIIYVSAMQTFGEQSTDGLTQIVIR